MPHNAPFESFFRVDPPQSSSWTICTADVWHVTGPLHQALQAASLLLDPASYHWQGDHLLHHHHNQSMPSKHQVPWWKLFDLGHSNMFIIICNVFRWNSSCSSWLWQFCWSTSSSPWWATLTGEWAQLKLIWMWQAAKVSMWTCVSQKDWTKICLAKR